MTKNACTLRVDVPERAFNEVLWKAIKGLNSEMPAPVRAAFVKMGEEDKD